MDVGRRGGRSRQLSPEQEAKLAFASLSRVGSKAESQITAEDGTFKIPEVPEGRYELLVDHDSFVPFRMEVIVSSRGMLGNYALTVDPGATLTGTGSSILSRRSVLRVELTPAMALKSLIVFPQNGRSSQVAAVTGASASSAARR